MIPRLYLPTSESSPSNSTFPTAYLTFQHRCFTKLKHLKLHLSRTFSTILLHILFSLSTDRVTTPLSHRCKSLGFLFLSLLIWSVDKLCHFPQYNIAVLWPDASVPLANHSLAASCVSYCNMLSGLPMTHLSPLTSINTLLPTLVLSLDASTISYPL